MRQYLLRIVALVMAVSIFTAGAGVPLFLHTCHMSGENELSLLPDDGCCPEEADETDGGDGCFIDYSCCQDKFFYFKSDGDARLQQTASATAPLPVILYLPVSIVNISAPLPTLEVSATAYMPRPPTRKEILQLIQIMRT